MERHGVDFESYTASLAGPKAISMNAKGVGNLGILAPAWGVGARTRSQILDAVWKGDGGDSFDQVIDVYIKELRKN